MMKDENFEERFQSRPGLAISLGLLVATVCIFAFGSLAFASGLGRIAIKTNPSGAKIYVQSTVVGVTPATISVPEGKTVSVRLVKKGYHSRTVRLTPSSGKTKRVSYTLRRR